MFDGGLMLASHATQKQDSYLRLTLSPLIQMFPWVLHECSSSASPVKQLIQLPIVFCIYLFSGSSKLMAKQKKNSYNCSIMTIFLVMTTFKLQQQLLQSW
mgnify:CR=1 FL=1